MEGQTSERVREVYPPDTIQKHVSILADKIIEDHWKHQDDLIMLCVMNRAVYFFTDLTKAMGRSIRNARMEFIRAKSYEGTESTGEVKITGDIGDLNGKHVIIVEDIIDTGLTIQKLIEHIKSKYEVAGVQVCALFKKQSDRMITDSKGMEYFTVDYLAWDIGDHFVVGYGLDYNGRYRNLPYVGHLSFSEAEDVTQCME